MLNILTNKCYIVSYEKEMFVMETRKLIGTLSGRYSPLYHFNWLRACVHQCAIFVCISSEMELANCECDRNPPVIVRLSNRILVFAASIFCMKLSNSIYQAPYAMRLNDCPTQQTFQDDLAFLTFIDVHERCTKIYMRMQINAIMHSLTG